MRWSLLASLLLCVVGCKDHKNHVHKGGHHRFEDPEHWAKMFDDPARDAWQQPDLCVQRLALAKDARVADIGAGTGYFAMRLAKAVPDGKVWAVDIEPGMVRYMNARARKQGHGNVTAILGTADDPLLPEPVDLILIVDTYHHIGNRQAYFEKLGEFLRPGGRIAIIDFKKGDLPVGPPDEMKLAPLAVTKELVAAGYARTAAHEMLRYQYFMVYEKRPGAR